jgi:hypothetical protein
MEFPGLGGHRVTVVCEPIRTALGSYAAQVTVAAGSIVEAIDVVGDICRRQVRYQAALRPDSIVNK